MRNSMFCLMVSLALPTLQLFGAVVAAQPTSEAPVPVAAVTPVSPAQIRFVHMGGSDCPPCVAWRAFEYPKLEKAVAFQAIKYSYVTKSVSSPVPSELFLPPELKPFKAKLDFASGGRSGSPHQTLIVNGEIYDYWFGAQSALQIEAKIAAITGGTKYPDKRCIRRAGGRDRTCAESY